MGKRMQNQQKKSNDLWSFALSNLWFHKRLKHVFQWVYVNQIIININCLLPIALKLWNSFIFYFVAYLLLCVLPERIYTPSPLRWNLSVFSLACSSLWAAFLHVTGFLFRGWVLLQWAVGWPEHSAQRDPVFRSGVRERRVRLFLHSAGRSSPLCRTEQFSCN